MKCKWLGGIFLGILSVCSTVEAGVLDRWMSSFWGTEAAQTPVVKVLIVHDQPGVVLEVKGKYKLYDPNTESFLSTRFIGKRKFIQALNDGLKWGEEFPGVHQIKVVPDDKKTTTLVDGVEYKGDVIVYDIGGTISVVNEIPLEEYLKVILVPQFDQKLSKEAANAVAISARTNALYQIQNSSNSYWAIEANKAGYQGSAAAAQDNGVAQAINETKRMVLTKDGAPFLAEWGSGTGGSANAQKPVFSRITLFEADELAKKGDNAQQILEKAYPGSKISVLES